MTEKNDKQVFGRFLRTKNDQKNAELIETKEIDGSTWHFFESPVTGKDGPSKPLMDELKKNDIIVEIHK